MKAEKLTKETINQLGMCELKHPEFEVGDHVSVSVRIKEGDKERLQAFEGDVIARNNNGASSTFTVRKIAAHSVAVERIFPLYSPIIESIKFMRHGKSRRAKLYYVRDRVGKAAQLKEVKKSKVVAKAVQKAPVSEPTPEVAPEPSTETNE